MLVIAFWGSRVVAGNVNILGFAPGQYEYGPGAVFVTSQNTNIDLGTRLYVGCFSDLGQLNATINNFKNGTTTYYQTITDLTSNFSNFGSGGDFGAVRQNGTTVEGQFVFNNSSSAVHSNLWPYNFYFNVPYGSINDVRFSTTVGGARDIYMWTAFDNEIALIRDSYWTTPTSDLGSITLNTLAINNQSEVLIGDYINPQEGGIGFIRTVPEPSAISLLVFGGVVVALGRRKK
jgi:hypothetical protein